MSRVGWVTLLVVAAALLISAVLLQLVVSQYFAYDTSTGSARNPRMQKLLSGPVEGWSVREEPLASTEAYAKNVAGSLNFDDYVYRVYSRGGVSFAVFVCYWGPNKMPANLVASHTPDRCWSQSGWTCDRFDVWANLRAGSDRLQPAFWRLFRDQSGQPQEVLYWHLIGGRTQIYGGNSFNQVVSWRFWWSEAFKFGVRGNEEQYFVRITSSYPLSAILNERGLQTVLERLAALGVRQN